MRNHVGMESRTARRNGEKRVTVFGGMYVRYALARGAQRQSPAKQGTSPVTSVSPKTRLRHIFLPRLPHLTTSTTRKPIQASLFSHTWVANCLVCLMIDVSRDMESSDVWPKQPGMPPCMCQFNVFTSRYTRTDSRPLTRIQVGSRDIESITCTQ